MHHMMHALKLHSGHASYGQCIGFNWD